MTKKTRPTQPAYSDEELETLRRVFEPQLMVAAALIHSADPEADAAGEAIDLMDDLLERLAQVEEEI